MAGEPMKRRAKTALGIDIGERQVSVALVEMDERGVRTVAGASGALPVGEPGTRQPAGAGVLAGLLRQLGKGVRSRGTKVALAMPMNPLVMQLLDMPRPVPTNVGAFVQNELRQYVALSGKAVLSDYWGVGAGSRKRLLAVATDAAGVQEALKACRAARVAVDVVEPSALACARALLERQKETGGTRDAIIAVLGPHHLVVCLFRKGALDFVRVRSVPVDAQAPEPLGVWLAEELRAVARYREAHASTVRHEVQTCVAVHDGAHAPGEIALLLAAEAGFGPVTVVDVREPSDRSPAQDGPAPPGASMAAVGAALAALGAGQGDLRVNLLPQAATEARSFARHVLLMANVGAVVFFGIFLLTQFLIRTTGAMDRRIEQARIAEQLYTTPGLIAREKFLDQEISSIRRHVDPLRQVVGARPETDWPGVLDVLRRSVPAQAWITHLQCSDGRTLSLTGLASSPEAALTFVRNLEGRAPFASVALARVQKRPGNDGRLEYQIDCILKAKGGSPS
jgi:Tfp pilus assembly protein PilN